MEILTAIVFWVVFVLLIGIFVAGLLRLADSGTEEYPTLGLLIIVLITAALIFLALAGS